MYFKNKLLWYILLSNIALFECAKENACAAKATIAGFVCTCNETYCDAINRPHPKKGNFVQYVTSEKSPGFRKTTGKMFNRGMQEHDFNTASNDIYIQVTDAIEYQSIIGVGASITDNSGVAINSLGPGAQQHFFESCFGAKGVEYSFLRVPIGASDFSQEYYTYDDVPGDIDLSNFSLNTADYTIKIPFIERARNISKRQIKLFATPWKAPDWMKTNNRYSAGYLYSRYMGVWANYFIKFLEAYSDAGIDFWGLSQGNEVVAAVYFGSIFNIPNTIMLPNQAREFTTKYIGPLIKQSKFKHLKMFLLDDVRPFMPWYSARVFADEEAAKYIDGISLHTYLDTLSSIPELGGFHDTYPDKDIIYTENSMLGNSSGGSLIMGDWRRAEIYLENIFTNLGNWAIGYIDWNIALNTVGGPGPQSLDAQLIVNMTNGEFYKQPNHYVLGHFSKFISVGAKRINITVYQDTPDIPKTFKSTPQRSLKDRPLYKIGLSTSDRDKVLTLAVKNPDGSRTLIVYNPKSEQVNMTLADAELGTFQATMDPKSLNSFCYK